MLLKSKITSSARALTATSEMLFFILDFFFAPSLSKDSSLADFVTRAPPVLQHHQPEQRMLLRALLLCRTRADSSPLAPFSHSPEHELTAETWTNGSGALWWQPKVANPVNTTLGTGLRAFTLQRHSDVIPLGAGALL